MRQKLKELLKEIKSENTQNPCLMPDFTQCFQQWLETLITSEGSIWDKFTVKNFIFENIKALVDLSQRGDVSFVECVASIREILIFLVLPQNDPEIRQEGFHALVVIISVFAKHVNYSIWGDLVKLAFNLIPDNRRIRVGNKSTMTGEICLDQIRKIAGLTPPTDQISFFYWAEIVVQFLFPAFMKGLPDKKNGFSCVLHFMGSIARAIEKPASASPLENIPIFKGSSVQYIFDSKFAETFLHAFDFLERYAETQIQRNNVYKTMQTFLKMTFDYFGAPTTTDEYICSKTEYLLVRSKYIPSQKTANIISNLASVQGGITAELINCFASLMEVFLQDPEKFDCFLSHMIRTKIFLSNWSLTKQCDDLIIVFAHKVMATASVKLVPYLIALIFALLIERGTLNVNTMESIYGAIAEKFDNPEYREIVLSVLSHISSQLALICLNKLTSLHLNKSAKDTVVNCVLYDHMVVHNELRNKFDKEGLNYYFFYIQESQESPEHCRKFILNFFKFFSEFDDGYLIAVFAKTLLDIIQKNRDQPCDASFLETDLLDLLFLHSKENFNTFCPIISDIMVKSTNLINKKRCMKFVIMLMNALDSDDAEIKKSALMCAIIFSVSGQHFCLTLVDKIYSLLPESDVKDIALYTPLTNFIITSISVSEHSTIEKRIQEAVCNVLEKHNKTDDLLTSIILVHGSFDNPDPSSKIINYVYKLIEEYEVSKGSSLSIFMDLPLFYKELNTKFPELFNRVCSTSISIALNLNKEQRKKASAFIANVAIQNDMEQFEYCKPFFSQFEKENDDYECVAHDYNYIIANFKKKSSNVEGKIENPTDIYISEDKTQFVTSKDQILISNTFGSHLYNVKGSIKLLINAVTEGKEVVTGPYKPAYAAIVKGFSKRSQRVLIRVNIGSENSELADKFFSSIGTKMISKNIDEKSFSEFTYVRVENKYIILFGNYSENSTISLVFGRRPVKTQTCINIYPVDNGFMGINAIGSITSTPIKGRVVLKKAAAIKIVLSIIVNMFNNGRIKEAENFFQSWIILSPSIAKFDNQL